MESYLTSEDVTEFLLKDKGDHKLATSTHAEGDRLCIKTFGKKEVVEWNGEYNKSNSVWLTPDQVWILIRFLDRWTSTYDRRKTDRRVNSERRA